MCSNTQTPHTCATPIQRNQTILLKLCKANTFAFFRMKLSLFYYFIVGPPACLVCVICYSVFVCFHVGHLCCSMNKWNQCSACLPVWYATAAFGPSHLLCTTNTVFPIGPLIGQINNDSFVEGKTCVQSQKALFLHSVTATLISSQVSGPCLCSVWLI